MEKNRRRKLPVGIGIPLDLLEEIDAKRGEESRSEFVLELIRKGLGQEPAKE